MISGKIILPSSTSVLTLLQYAGLTTLFRRASSSSTAVPGKLLASQVFDDYIYICVINRTEAHRKGLFVYFILRNRHVVSFIKIGDNTVSKVRVGVSVFIHQVVNQVERLELVV